MKMKFGFALVVLVVCVSSLAEGRYAVKKKNQEKNLLAQLRNLLLNVRDDDPPKPPRPIVCRLSNSTSVVKECVCPSAAGDVPCPDAGTGPEVKLTISLSGQTDALINLAFCTPPADAPTPDFQMMVAHMTEKIFGKKKGSSEEDDDSDEDK